jgi:hypothetical protein
MLKPLREEQADMKARWSDPSYRWANDSNLRRQFHVGDKSQVPSSMQSAGLEVEQGARAESATRKEGEPK